MHDRVDLDILDVVALTRDMPAHDLRRGQVGTIVEALRPGMVEVEFSDDDGRAYALVAVDVEQLLVLHYQPAHRDRVLSSLTP